MIKWKLVVLIGMMFLCFKGFSFGSDSLGLKTYNKLKYLAENSVLEDDYCLGAKFYKDLFDGYELWNNDLQNALISSLYCGDMEGVEKFTLELLKRGAPHEFFEEELEEFQFFSSERWEEFKSMEIEFIYDPELRQKVLDMRDVDQEDRSDDANRPFRDYLNLIELNKIILSKGFPTEMDLGFDYSKCDLNYNRYFNNILLHLVKLQPWDFGQMLQKWYFERKISPGKFLYLAAFSETCDDYKLTCLAQPASNVLFVDGVLFSCSSTEIEKVNIDRKLFHLDLVEDQINKVKYRRENKDVGWAMDTGYSTFNYNERKYDFESIKNKLQKEESLIPYSDN